MTVEETVAKGIAWLDEVRPEKAVPSPYSEKFQEELHKLVPVKKK